ncbi:hypothetical protein M1N55_06545 [Dehalococcoidia bacterium]|nr:hypothetical protein [Dehalococcoidia bacterium]
MKKLPPMVGEGKVKIKTSPYYLDTPWAQFYEWEGKFVKESPPEGNEAQQRLAGIQWESSEIEINDFQIFND